MGEGLPQVPARCSARPLAGGRVIPYVSVMLHDGRPVLGAVHRSKAVRCIVGRLCQVCGERLGRPLVVIVDQGGVLAQYSGEAALHPECAAYSRNACPVLAGHRETFRVPDRHIGNACSEPGCGCGGWTNTEPDRELRGSPVGPWHAVWLDDYAIAVNENREVHGLTWQGMSPRRIRPLHPCQNASHERRP